MRNEPIWLWPPEYPNARSATAMYFQYVIHVSAPCVLALLCMSSLASASEDLAHPVHDVAESISDPAVNSLLSTDEILETFSNTLDRGAVQRGNGISAETRWYASGRFETRWWREGDLDDSPDTVNLVTGRWTKKNTSVVSSLIIRPITRGSVLRYFRAMTAGWCRSARMVAYMDFIK